MSFRSAGDRVTMAFRSRLWIALLAVLLGLTAPAAAADLESLVEALNDGSYSKKAEAVDALAATGDLRAAPILVAFGDGLLFVRRSDGRIVIGRMKGGEYELNDAVTGEAAGTEPEGALERIKINNRVRRSVSAAPNRRGERERRPGPG